IGLPLGAVRLTHRFLGEDPPSPVQLRALRREIGRQLEHLTRPFAPGVLVGLGGTVRSLARMYLAATGRQRRALHGVRLPATGVADLAARLAACPLRRRRKIPGLKAERADVIVAGAAVIDEVMAWCRHEAITICDRGVRHGVLIRETFGRAVSA